MDHYRCNIKQKVTIAYLYAIKQSSNEKLDKFKPRFKKGRQTINSKLDEEDINHIFVDALLQPLKPFESDLMDET